MALKVKKKRKSARSVPAARSYSQRPSQCPDSSNGQLQRPHANMYMDRMTMLAHHLPSGYNISTKPSIAATFLTNPESCEVSNCQERALSNASQYVYRIPPLQPISGLCGRYAPAKIINPRHKRKLQRMNSSQNPALFLSLLMVLIFRM